MIEVKNIWKSFGSLQVLKGVNLQVGQGEIVCIIGQSGAGKTTLLQIMGTLDKPDKGQVLFDGKDVFTLSETALAEFRNCSVNWASKTASPTNPTNCQAARNSEWLQRAR